MPGKTRHSGKSESGLGEAAAIKQLNVCLRIVSRVTIDIKVEKEAEASSGRWGLVLN
jgi:hypothetical protein